MARRNKFERHRARRRSPDALSPKATLSVLKASGASNRVRDWTGYADDPVGFLRDALGYECTEDQARIARSVVQNPETNVQSCHSIGKSSLGACLVIWWVFAKRGEVVTTAPTARQVKKIIWKEVRQRYDQHKAVLGGRRNTQELILDEKAFGWGFSARDGDTNAAAGNHASLILFVVDEACGVSPEIDAGLRSCATGRNNRILRIGNPVLAGTVFEKACQRSHLRVTVWTHPNVAPYYDLHPDGIHRLKPGVNVEECIEVIPGAVTPLWIEMVRETEGEDSFFWRTRVEALFPTDPSNAVFPLSYWQSARQLYDADPEYWDEMARRGPIRLALDVGGGNDDSAIAVWRGPVLTDVWELPGKGDRQDVIRSADWLIEKLIELETRTNGVDASGLGAGALDHMLRNGYPSVAWDWGGAPLSRSDKLSRPLRKFHNRKAEQFWALREAVRQNQIAIAPLGPIEEKFERLYSRYW